MKKILIKNKKDVLEFINISIKALEKKQSPLYIIAMMRVIKNKVENNLPLTTMEYLYLTKRGSRQSK